MLLRYNETAAKACGLDSTYQTWFKRWGVNKNEPVKLISRTSQGYINVTRPKGSWRDGVSPVAEVSEKVYLPVVLDGNLEDYL